MLGIAVSSVLLAIVHFSTDLLLNLDYLIFAVGTGLITWRTGGIEIAMVLHVGLNTLGFLPASAVGGRGGRPDEQSRVTKSCRRGEPCAANENRC